MGRSSRRSCRRRSCRARSAPILTAMERMWLRSRREAAPTHGPAPPAARPKPRSPTGGGSTAPAPATAADTVTGFSSRGPTRGRTTLDDGTAWTDNLLKPDLVAPGNRVVAALSSDVLGTRAGWNQLVTTYPQLAMVAGATQAPNQTLMEL